MFASKTPRDLNHDPAPFLDERGSRWISPVTFQPRTFTYSPRPEFDHAQHNEPNPILMAFRRDAEEMKRELGWDTQTTARSWGRDAFYSFVDMYPTEFLDHARKVLTRLANLSQIGA